MFVNDMFKALPQGNSDTDSLGGRQTSAPPQCRNSHQCFQGTMMNDGTLTSHITSYGQQEPAKARSKHCQKLFVFKYLAGEFALLLVILEIWPDHAPSCGFGPCCKSDRPMYR